MLTESGNLEANFIAKDFNLLGVDNKKYTLNERKTAQNAYKIFGFDFEVRESEKMFAPSRT